MCLAQVAKRAAVADERGDGQNGELLGIEGGGRGGRLAVDEVVCRGAGEVDRRELGRVGVVVG